MPSLPIACLFNSVFVSMWSCVFVLHNSQITPIKINYPFRMSVFLFVFKSIRKKKRLLGQVVRNIYTNYIWANNVMFSSCNTSWILFGKAVKNHICVMSPYLVQQTSLHHFDLCCVYYVGAVLLVTSWWVRWRIKSPASRLFTLSFIQGAYQGKHQSSASVAFVTGEFPDTKVQ